MLQIAPSNTEGLVLGFCVLENRDFLSISSEKESSSRQAVNWLVCLAELFLEIRSSQSGDACHPNDYEDNKAAC